MKKIYEQKSENWLVFYNYKEPLKEIKNGYGYYGAILATEDGTKIQCHLCGGLYGELQAHIRMFHSIKARDYKEKFELAYTTSLVSESIRNERKMRTLKWLKTLTPEQKKSFEEKRKKRIKEFWENKLKKRNQPLLTLETKNKRGTCPDQLIDKIKKCAEVLGHQPSKREFIDFYKSQKYLHIIYKTFGSWQDAVKRAGFKDKLSTQSKGRKKKIYSKEEIIDLFKLFYQENNKPPTETDCRRGLIPNSQVIRRLFGSMAQARLESGIKDEVGRWKNY